MAGRVYHAWKPSDMVGASSFFWACTYPEAVNMFHVVNTQDVFSFFCYLVHFSSILSMVRQDYYRRTRVARLVHLTRLT